MRRPQIRCRAVVLAVVLATPAALISGVSTSAEPVPRPARTGNAWVVVPGVDTDGNGRADRVRVHYTLPAGRPPEVPVVVEPSPYWSGVNRVRNHDVDRHLHVPRDPVAAMSGARFGSAYAPMLMRHGYGYAFAESLGTGASTGCPTSGGPNETAGMVAVVRWLAGHGRAYNARGQVIQAPWSSGRVGMIGVSYNGTLANAVAATGVRGLRAIIPVSAISRWYDYYRSQGMVRAPGGFQGEDTDVLAKYVLTRSRPQACAAEVRSLTRRQDRLTGDASAFWAARDYRHAAERVRAAVLSLHGLSDRNVQSDQTGRWLHALDRAGAVHQSWWHSGGHGDPLIGFDQTWRSRVVDWFDRFLRGRRTGVLGRPGSVTVRAGDYWRQRSWPAPAADPVRLWPQADRDHGGRLTLTSADDRTQRLVDDARHSLASLLRRGPLRHRLVWRTAPLVERMALSGLGSVDIRVSFSRRAANLSVGLADLAPDGHATILSRGWMDPQNLRSLRHGVALEPGRVYRLHVQLDGVLQHRVAPGHRLALVVAASDHDFTLRPPAGTRLLVRTAATSVRLPVIGGRQRLLDALR